MPAGRPKEAPTREPPGRYYCPTCGELLSSHGKNYSCPERGEYRAPSQKEQEPGHDK